MRGTTEEVQDGYPVQRLATSYPSCDLAAMRPTAASGTPFSMPRVLTRVLILMNCRELREREREGGREGERERDPPREISGNGVRESL